MFVIWGIVKVLRVFSGNWRSYLFVNIIMDFDIVFGLRKVDVFVIIFGIICWNIFLELKKLFKFNIVFSGFGFGFSIVLLYFDLRIE